MLRAWNHDHTLNGNTTCMGLSYHDTESVATLIRREFPVSEFNCVPVAISMTYVELPDWTV
jgi:hypothetical protein